MPLPVERIRPPQLEVVVLADGVRHLLQLLQDREAATHEPGSAGYVARMFALRQLSEGTA